MTPERLEAFVDASAQALGLPLQPEHRPGVLRYVALAAEMAAVLDAVALDVHAGPATTFTPVSPPRSAP